MKSILFGNSAVTFADAIYISVVSMLIVFFILFLILKEKMKIIKKQMIIEFWKSLKN